MIVTVIWVSIDFGLAKGKEGWMREYRTDSAR